MDTTELKDIPIPIPKVIMNYIHRIINKLVIYIKNNLNNINYLEQRLSYLDKHLYSYFFNLFPSETPLSISDYNSKVSKINSIDKYLLTKLKRKLKKQHDSFQSKELAYLEKIVEYEKQIKKSKEENSKDLTHKRNQNSLLFPENRKLIHKKFFTNITTGKNIYNPMKKIFTPIKRKFKKNIIIMTFDNNNNDNTQDKNEEIHYKTYNNFYPRKNKFINQSLNEYEINASSKNKKKFNELSCIKHDFGELKKTIEEGKKKIIQLKGSIFN